MLATVAVEPGEVRERERRLRLGSIRHTEADGGAKDLAGYPNGREDAHPPKLGASRVRIPSGSPRRP